MSTLHVINKTVESLWQSCASVLSKGDALLLIEDAVYAALPAQPQLALLPAGTHLHALADDLALRGISAKIRPGIEQITYNQFVALSLAHERVVSWQ